MNAEAQMSHAQVRRDEDGQRKSETAKRRQFQLEQAPAIVRLSIRLYGR